MPIEFRCTSCAKLLRTPDESAGKRAKCPQCGTIVDVPDSSQETNRDDAVPTGDVARNPFAPSDADTRPAQQDPINPYSSPATMAPASKPEAAPAELQHSRIEFDDTLRTSWAFFMENLKPLALFGAVVFGISVGMQIVGQAGGVAVQAANEPALFVVFTTLNTIIGILVQTFVSLGTVIYMLKMVRTREAKINDLFAAGPYLVKGILLYLLLALVFGGIVLVCIGPGLATIPLEEPGITGAAIVVGAVIAIPLVITLALRFTLCWFFLVDRSAGVMESLTLSGQYMQGNKLTAFLIFLVVGVLGGIFFLCTCCFGQIFYIPYGGILASMIYLTCTGQPFDQVTGNKQMI